MYTGQKKPAIRDVSLSIAAGEKVGVIGRVGSGKTSLLRVMAGLSEATEGDVRLGGIDITHLHPDDLRANVGVVMQQPLLFSGSLKANILLGCPHATDEMLLKACRIAGVDEIAAQLPQGYETLLYERGGQLSGGQRQAVCIARALIGDPPIVIMDEPSSAMDSAGERELLERLRVALSDRTVIVITHRGTLLDLVDRVLAFDQGRVVAEGPKAQILKRATPASDAPHESNSGASL